MFKYSPNNIVENLCVKVVDYLGIVGASTEKEIRKYLGYYKVVGYQYEFERVMDILVTRKHVIYNVKCDLYWAA